MNSSPLEPSIRELAIAERIDLVTAIWDSIAEDRQLIPLSELQRHELDRRLAARQENPEASEPWETVKAELLGE